ncbi:helix-turn-helix domain-containing protein [Levilactobacillus zymae]|uniref:helix-turn-helix domain-containing protein n=1 Tax=Levilactobacillus zymae TaxID=267363 RepID=UPI000B3FD28B|nr:helix-turn-helix transcriptional regulator [Levilactobacillus zymae]
MNKLDDYVTRRGQTSPAFAQAVKQEDLNLDAAVAVRQLRDSLQLSQRAFAQQIGKPQSTVARIESGSMTISTKLLAEIASATGQRLQIQFIPVHE